MEKQDRQEARASGGRRSLLSLRDIEREAVRFRGCRLRREMLTGEKYYAGKHDILHRRRMAIGEGGEMQEISNLPNNRLVDNQYRKLVCQKTDYLLGKPMLFRGVSEEYGCYLVEIFGEREQRLLHSALKRALNQGICYLMPGYDRAGRFCLRCFNGYELCPGWRDGAHSAMDYAIRLYTSVEVIDGREKRKERVEYFDRGGIWRYILEGDRLKADEPAYQPYLWLDGREATWERLPIIALKRDAEETPLIGCVKGLQDSLNTLISDFQNAMEEDARNTIMILVNYDGENLGEFRRNLATYGAVKVRSSDGSAGDVRTLQVEVNAENHKAIIDIFRRAIVENGMGVDARDERFGNSPNQMNIRSMYTDLDLDASEMEAELRGAIRELLWFVNCHLYNLGRGSFFGEHAQIVFRRSLPVNESEMIDNIIKSRGLVSDEALLARHPYAAEQAGLSLI